MEEVFYKNTLGSDVAGGASQEGKAYAEWNRSAPMAAMLFGNENPWVLDLLFPGPRPFKR